MATSTKSGDKPVKTKPAAAPQPKTSKAKPAATAAKPVKKAPATKVPATRKPTAKKAAPPAAARSATSRPLPDEKRRYYVEVAAYYIAERRGFPGGSQLDDWVQAEIEIDRLLREGVLKP